MSRALCFNKEEEEEEEDDDDDDDDTIRATTALPTFNVDASHKGTATTIIVTYWSSRATLPSFA